MTSPDYDSLDESLEILAPVEGLGNHGPMAAEALCSLGRGKEAVRWVERYKTQFKPFHERPRAPFLIDEGNWREVLGRIDLMKDWSQFFQKEIDTSPWPTILDRWVMRLSPGFSAVAMHGAIRTCHAVRALDERDSNLRRLGLADGLAHWAAGYAALPVGAWNREKLTAFDAIRAIERLPVDQREPATSIMQSLKDLEGFTLFPPVIDAIDFHRPIDDLISEITEVFAGTFLSNSEDFLATIAFVHSVTGPAGLRLIAHHISPETLREVLRYAWQSSAAVYMRFGENLPAKITEVEIFHREELIDRAVACGDEHAIKFTEACLREYDLNPRPVYRAAAMRVVDRLSREP